MSLPRPRVILFDLDGTLIDTMFAFADLAAEVMASHHGAEPGAAKRRYLETSGIPFCQQLEVIHPGHAANARASDEFEERKRRITAAAFMDEPTLAGLWALRELDIRLVVSSNTGQEFVDEFVAKEPFAFDLALGFDPSQGLAKGRPHVERAVETFSVQCSQMLFVGDSLKDGELAAENGLGFVGRIGTFARADFQRCFPAAPTVDTIDQLPALF